jgi:hypothetical protein
VFVCAGVGCAWGLSVGGDEVVGVGVSGWGWGWGCRVLVGGDGGWGYVFSCWKDKTRGKMSEAMLPENKIAITIAKNENH